MELERFKWRRIRSLIGVIAWCLLAACILIFMLIVLSDDDQLRTLLPGIFSPSYDGTRIGAAEYLTFVVGVPAAILTSLVAIVIAAASRDNSKDQVLIQKIDLLDKKLNIASSTYFRNITIIEDFSSFVTFTDVRDSLVSSKKLESENNLAEKGKIEELIAQEEKNIDALMKEHQKSFSMIDTQYDLFWKKAEEIHLKGFQQWRDVFAYVTKSLNRHSMLNTPRDFIRELATFASFTTPDEFERLKNCLPGDKWHRPLEMAGGLLWLVDQDGWPAEFEAEFFEEGDEPLLFFNVGASLLVATLNAIPSASAIKKTAEQTFGEETVRENSYLSAIKALDDAWSDSLKESVDIYKREPWQLIYKFSGPDNVVRLGKDELERTLKSKGESQSLSFSAIRGRAQRSPISLNKRSEKNTARKIELARSHSKAHYSRKFFNELR